MKLKDIIGSMASKFAALALALTCAWNVWGAETRQVSTLAELTDAITAASAGDTIQLTADITVSGQTITFDKALTLDLNGKTLTLKYASWKQSYLKNTAPLTVVGGTIASSCSLVNDFGIWSESDLTLDGVTITANSTNTSSSTDGNVYAVYQVNGTLTIKDSSLRATAKAIKSGIEKNYAYAVYVANPCEGVSISGSSLSVDTTGRSKTTSDTSCGLYLAADVIPALSQNTISGIVVANSNSKDMTIGDGNVINGDLHGISHSGTGTVTVDGITVNSGTAADKSYGVSNEGTGTIVITGNASITGKFAGACNSKGGTVVIESGTVTATYANTGSGVRNDGPGSVVIDGGAISGQYGVLNSGAGTITVNDGEITGKNAGANSGAVINYSTATGTIDIKGGTVNAAGNAVYSMKGTVAVSGGTVNGTIKKAANGTVTVSGGTFTTDVSSYLAADSTQTDNGNGTYTIVSPVAKLERSGEETQYFIDLHEALEAGKAAGSVVTLLADVDLAGVNWVPVGTEADRFRGTFDGNGKTISNLTIDYTAVATSGTTYGGLIGGAQGATISNVKLNNVVIKNGTNPSEQPAAGYGGRYGSVVGRLYGGTVSNCTVTNVEIQDMGHNGGIVGATEANSTIENCKVQGTILIASGSNSGGGWDVGGILGKNNVGAVTIKGCTVDGTSAATSKIYSRFAVGGIVGYTVAATITDCTVKKVTVEGSSNAHNYADEKVRCGAGGIMGELKGTISGCSVENVVVKYDDTTTTGAYAAVGLIGGACEDSSATINVSDCTVSESSAYWGETKVNHLDPGRRTSGTAMTVNYTNTAVGSIVSNGITTYYVTAVDAIAAADREGVDEIAIIDNKIEESPDNAWKIDGDKLVRKTYVAQIGTTKYESLAAAVAAVPTDGTETTITMLAGETIVADAGITIAAGKNIVLDLNGQTVQMTAASADERWLIKNEGSLTVKDSAENGKLLMSATGQASTAVRKSTIKNMGSLTVESGTIELTYSGTTKEEPTTILNDASDRATSLTVKGGTVVNSANRGMGVYLAVNDTNATVVDVQGGRVEGYGSAVRYYFDDRALTDAKLTFSMSNGTIHGRGMYGIHGMTTSSKDWNGISFDISGGTISCVGLLGLKHVISPLQGAVSISGGTFNGDVYIYGHYLNITDGNFNGAVTLHRVKESLASASISGGQFKGALTIAETTNENTTNPYYNAKFVSGGIYGTAPAARNVVDGNVVVDNTDSNTQGDYPKAIGGAVASVDVDENTTYYATLADAIAAANEAGVDEITILNGATESPDAAWKVADGKLVRKSYVAQIGTTKYETIDELLAGLRTAIAGGSYANTITFLADVELADNFVIPQEMAQCPTTFDLNGKHITLATGRTHAIRNYGQLTLVDSVGGGSVTAPIPVINMSGATLNMQGGTLISNAQSGNAVNNDGTFNMAGGSLQVSYAGSSSDSSGPACLYNSGTATITKGTLTSASQRCYAIINSGTLTINPAADSDVAVTGTHGAVAVDGGTVSISGGSYTATNYYALYVSNEASNPTVTVTGGTFDGNAYSAYIGSDVNESVTASVAISGGTFNDPIIESSKVADGSGFAISGGNFTTAVAEDYCATGYIPTAQDSQTGMYTVKTGSYFAQIVGGEKFESLQAAVDAAQDGDTVQLLADIDLGSHARNAHDDIVLEGITLDLNGKTIRGFNNGVRYSGSNAVIKNGTFDFVAAEATPSYALSIGSWTDGVAKSTGMQLENLTVNGGINVDNADVTLTDVTINQGAGAYYCLWVDEDNNASATFVSGTINAGANATAVFGVAKASSGTTTDGTLNVQGGMINANGEKLVLASGNHIQVSGGYFDAVVPEEHCAENYMPTTTPDENDMYTVVLKGVAKIGDTYYQTLAESSDAAEAGDTVVLLKDVAEPFVLQKNVSVTLNLNGNTISVADGNAILATAGELTITSVVDDDGNATGGVSGLISVSEGAALNIQGGIYDVDWDDCDIEGSIAVSSVNTPWDEDPTEVGAASALFTSPVPYEYCADGFIPGEDLYVGGEWYYYVKEGSYLWRITDADGKVAYSEDVPEALDDEEKEYWEMEDWFDENEMNRNGFTMTLLHDVVVDDDSFFSAYVSGLTYTVDLGGHTVNGQMSFGAGKCYATVTNGVVSCAGGTAMSVANGAQVTLADNLVISQSVTGVYVGGGTEADEYSKLTVKEGATISATDAVTVFGSGSDYPVTEVIVEGGTIMGTEFGISGNGTIEDYEDNSNTKITISGGTITGDGVGIYHPQAGTLSVSGGAISGGVAIYAKSGTISVTGGELSANGAVEQYDVSYTEDGPQYTGDAFVVDSANYHGGKPTATISGGTFISLNGNGVASYALTGQTTVSNFVSGGYFSQYVTDIYCAPGYLCTTKPVKDELYQVVPAKTVTYTLVEGDADRVGAALPSPASFAYPSGDMAEIALTPATCTDGGYTFAGWKVSGEGDAIAALPAGTTGDITLVATWTGAKSIQIDAGGKELTTIKVTDEWLDANGLADEEDTDVIKAALEETADNGVPAWENYVLGQSIDAAVSSGAEQGETTLMPVTSTIDVPAVDTGFDVQYRLDKVDASGSVVAEGTAQATPDLALELSGVASSAYYRLAAVVTAKDVSGASVSVQANNTIGVLKVESGAKTTAIAVPWEALGGGDISVSNIVRTATLTTGDELKAYDKTTDKYKVWTLSADKTWEPNLTTTSDSTTLADGADLYTVKRGSAVWLTRQDTTQPIYLVGEVAATAKAEVTLDAGSATEPSWNLVGSAGTEPVKVSEIAAATDKIVVPTAYIPKEYEYDAKQGGWGYWDYETVIKQPSGRKTVNKVWKAAEDIPAGTGFWYLNGGGEKDINL